MHITHNIRYYAKLLLLRNTKRITQNMLIYAKTPILRNNLLGRLKQGALPFECLPMFSWHYSAGVFTYGYGMGLQHRRVECRPGCQID